MREALNPYGRKRLFGIAQPKKRGGRSPLGGFYWGALGDSDGYFESRPPPGTWLSWEAKIARKAVETALRRAVHSPGSLTPYTTILRYQDEYSPFVWRGGFRHGFAATEQDLAFDSWWRKRVVEIVR